METTRPAGSVQRVQGSSHEPRPPPNAVSSSQPHCYEISRVDDDITSMLMLASCSWPHFEITDTNNPVASFFAFPRSKGEKCIFEDPRIRRNDNKSRRLSTQRRQRRASLCLSARHSGSPGYICSVMWSDSNQMNKKKKNKITQPGPKMLFYLPAF